MKEGVAGFKTTGTWADVVEHGERISRALRECGVEGEDFDDWEAWRPKSTEHIETDVSEKTADQASVAKGAGERKGKSPNEDLRTAGQRLTESYEDLEEDTDAAIDKWHNSVDYVTRAADSAGRKMLRRVEHTVYQKVMTQLAPYYFDNGLISANITRAGGNGDGERFVFEVNINGDELKARVSEELTKLDERIDRWHVDAEKDVSAAAAAEGLEVADAELERTTAEPETERLEDPRGPPTEQEERD